MGQHVQRSHHPGKIGESSVALWMMYESIIVCLKYGMYAFLSRVMCWQASTDLWKSICLWVNVIITVE